MGWGNVLAMMDDASIMIFSCLRHFALGVAATVRHGSLNSVDEVANQTDDNEEDENDEEDDDVALHLGGGFGLRCGCGSSAGLRGSNLRD